MLPADILLPQSDVVSSQQSSQQSDQPSSQQSSQPSSQRSLQHSSQQFSPQFSQPMSSPPQHSNSKTPSQHCLRNITFPPLPLQHVGSDQSAPNQSGRTWHEASVMTPRQLAVEQLLSHKLNGLPSQQALVTRPQSVDTISAVSPKSPEPGPSAGQDVDPACNHNANLSVVPPEALQVLKLQACALTNSYLWQSVHWLAAFDAIMHWYMELHGSALHCSALHECCYTPH